MWSHHGKKSRQIKFISCYICIYIGSILILALKSEISGSLVGLSALHPQHSFVSPAVSRFSGPPTPTPNRWCCWCYLWSLAEIQVVQWILPFRILWRWLKVDGTPFTWYFRITKITKLLSGGLKLRSKTLAAGIVAQRRDRGKSFAMTITFWSTVAVALWHRIYRSSMRTKFAVSSSKI